MSPSNILDDHQQLKHAQNAAQPSLIGSNKFDATHGSRAIDMALVSWASVLAGGRS